MSLNVSSAVGFIALFGMAVSNAVLMLAQINRLRGDVQRPLATLVVGALVTATATALTLLLLPALYYLIEAHRQKRLSDKGVKHDTF